MQNQQQVAEKIKLIAKANGISVNKMLIDCKLGKNTISKMSKGTDILSQNLAKIADYLGCSVDYLLGRTEERQGHAAQQNAAPSASGNDLQKKRLIENYDELNSSGKTKLTDYSDDLCGNPAYTSSHSAEKRQA